MATAHPLDRLRVTGYRSIRDQSLELRSLNLLVGANGAGKSNLIELFDFLGALVDGRLSTFVAQRGGASQLLHGGPSVTPEMSLHLEFGPNAYGATLAYGAKDNFVFSSEVGYFHNSGRFSRPYNKGIASGGQESNLRASARRDGGTLEYVVASLEAYRVYHFHDTSPTAAVKRKGPIGDNRVLRSDAANLSAYLYRLRETDRPVYDRIVSGVRTVAPFFLDFDLHPDALSPDLIQLEWSQKGSDQYLNANALSDGTLRFICLAALLLSNEGPRLLVLDEPELGLHPFAIRQLAAMLRAVSSERQVIVATQAVPLVDQFGLEDVIAVDRVNGASEFRRLESAGLESWLADYSLGELWDKNLLGGGPRSEAGS